MKFDAINLMELDKSYYKGKCIYMFSYSTVQDKKLITLTHIYNLSACLFLVKNWIDGVFWMFTFTWIRLRNLDFSKLYATFNFFLFSL